MTVYTFVSAKGSPGASTAVTALAAAWPVDVAVADVDPAGGDHTWWTRNPEGQPLDPDLGLLSLGAAVRRGADKADLTDHLQPGHFGRELLVGVTSPDQLTGLGAAWSQIPAVFGRHGADVLVDCGRLAVGSSAMPLVARSDVLVFVVRPDLSGVAHLRERLRSLKTELDFGPHNSRPVFVLVVTDHRDNRTVSDLQQLLDTEQFGIRVLGIVADDAKGVGILTGQRPGSLRRTLLMRSARQLAADLHAAVAPSTPPATAAPAGPHAATPPAGPQTAVPYPAPPGAAPPPPPPTSTTPANR